MNAARWQSRAFELARRNVVADPDTVDPKRARRQLQIATARFQRKRPWLTHAAACRAVLARALAEPQ